MRDLLQAKRDDNSFSTNKVRNMLLLRQKITWLHAGKVAQRSRDSKISYYTRTTAILFSLIYCLFLSLFRFFFVWFTVSVYLPFGPEHHVSAEQRRRGRRRGRGARSRHRIIGTTRATSWTTASLFAGSPGAATGRWRGGGASTSCPAPRRSREQRGRGERRRGSGAAQTRVQTKNDAERSQSRQFLFENRCYWWVDHSHNC